MNADVGVTPEVTASPTPLVRQWFENAVAASVREPGAMALATASDAGRASTRIVQVLELRDSGVVFASHTGSRKGREIQQNGWASGVFYWREIGRQIVISGPTGPLPPQDSDVLWAARPTTALPMSVASEQSAILGDEAALRAKVDELTRSDVALPRPTTWVGFLLRPSSVEFWEMAKDRLHHRVRYDHNPSGWHTTRLQP